MTNDIAGTWLWANLLHPFIMFFYFGSADRPSGAELFGALYLALTYSFILSLPSLFTSWLFIYLVSLLKYSPGTSFLLWLIAAPLVTLINFALISLLAGGGTMDLFELEFTAPALIAVVVTVIARYRYFIKTCIPQKENEHETTIV